MGAIPDKIFFTQTARGIIEELRRSFAEKDMIVTGQTVNSIRFQITEEGFIIWGASYIEVNERGRPPRRSNTESDFLQRLEVWRQRRGIKTPAKSLRYLINKKGTRLWQGTDRRFPGKKSSGVITDIINEELIKKLNKNYFQNKVSFIFSEVVKSF